MKKIIYIIFVVSMLSALSAFFLKINHYGGFQTVLMIAMISFFLFTVLILTQIGMKVFKNN